MWLGVAQPFDKLISGSHSKRQMRLQHADILLDWTFLPRHSIFLRLIRRCVLALRIVNSHCQMLFLAHLIDRAVDLIFIRGHLRLYIKRGRYITWMPSYGSFLGSIFITSISSRGCGATRGDRRD